MLYQGFFRATLMLLCFYTFQANARPVSYVGGKTAMVETNAVMDVVNAHYTPSRNYSIGYYGANFRNINTAFNGVGFNYLLKRINTSDAQFNFYFESAIGNFTKYGNQVVGNNTDNFGGISDGKNNLGGFAGVAFDGENRRFYVSSESMAWHKNGMHMLKHSGRLGIAPYVAEYGGLHTWFMVQLDAVPKAMFEQATDTSYVYTATPLLRFFHDVYLFEVGYNIQRQGPLVHFMVRM